MVTGPGAKSGLAAWTFGTIPVDENFTDLASLVSLTIMAAPSLFDCSVFLADILAGHIVWLLPGI
jgi:hypothetical protein